MKRILPFTTGSVLRMRKIYVAGFIGILLALVAICPAVAISPVTTAVQGGSYGSAMLHAYSSQGNYFSNAALVKSEQGRFVGSTHSYTLQTPASRFSIFAPYSRFTTGNPPTYTESDNGKTFTVARGQVVIIRLGENPSTGYRWEPSVSAGIQVTDDTFERSTSGALGAGGVRVWTLSITGTGDQHFNAEYKRSWEPGYEGSYSINFIVA